MRPADLQPRRYYNTMRTARLLGIHGKTLLTLGGCGKPVLWTVTLELSRRSWLARDPDAVDRPGTTAGGTKVQLALVEEHY